MLLNEALRSLLHERIIHFVRRLMAEAPDNFGALAAHGRRHRIEHTTALPSLLRARNQAVFGCANGSHEASMADQIRAFTPPPAQT